MKHNYPRKFQFIIIIIPSLTGAVNDLVFKREVGASLRSAYLQPVLSFADVSHLIE